MILIYYFLLRAIFCKNQAVSGNLQKWMFQKCRIFTYFTQNNERNNSGKYFLKIFIFGWVIEAQIFNVFTGKSARWQNFGFWILLFPMGTGIHHILLLFTKLEVKLYQKNYKKLLGSIAWSIYHQITKNWFLGSFWRHLSPLDISGRWLVFLKLDAVM